MKYSYNNNKNNSEKMEHFSFIKLMKILHVSLFLVYLSTWRKTSKVIGKTHIYWIWMQRKPHIQVIPIYKFCLALYHHSSVSCRVVKSSSLKIIFFLLLPLALFNFQFVNSLSPIKKNRIYQNFGKLILPHVRALVLLYYK